ncbi:MAG: BlaI/MecI/CopY family transcriptional regulator [Spirochaetales bacterium]|nr:BlaI/MecI/CopY family transcriptional regulator [Spirochaetales bacterium]
MAALNIKSIDFKMLSHLISPFEISETSLRTSLSRMVKKGLLSVEKNKKEAVYYRARKNNRISSNISAPFTSPGKRGWDYDYWGVLYSVPGAEASPRHKIRKKLVAYRYGLWSPGLWIRPVLTGEKPYNGLEELSENPYCRLIRFTPDQKLKRDECSRIWHLEEKVEIMNKAIEKLKNAMSMISDSTPEAAFKFKMEIGESAVRALASDPLLPNEQLPEKWPAEELRELFGRWDNDITKIAEGFYIPILKGESV